MATSKKPREKKTVIIQVKNIDGQWEDWRNADSAKMAYDYITDCGDNGVKYRIATVHREVMVTVQTKRVLK